MDVWLPRSNEAIGSSAAATNRRARRSFLILLALQIVLLIVRWWMGDAHGALLMFAVCSVGALALTVGNRGVDEVYSGYFGLMALVSGLLDLNLAVENIVWGDWRAPNRHEPGSKGGHGHIQVSWEQLSRPALYLVCSAVQLLAAFVSYLLYKDAELDGDFDVGEPVFIATQDQARIYNSVLNHTERTAPAQALLASPQSPMKHFVGSAHKLP
mmetsp:Transcript_50327/g.113085  ORF Transcript_50327/g.113085 Transcript_50327/m.113085 type:complete len:213 (+) Transcript_50327:128-766(+)